MDPSSNEFSASNELDYHPFVCPKIPKVNFVFFFLLYSFIKGCPLFLQFEDI